LRVAKIPFSKNINKVNRMVQIRFEAKDFPRLKLGAFAILSWSFDTSVAATA